MSMKQTMCEFVHGMTCKEVCEFLGEIVRCRDCAYRGWSEAGGHFCARGIGLTVELDGYCKWGERREQ